MNNEDVYKRQRMGNDWGSSSEQDWPRRSELQEIFTRSNSAVDAIQEACEAVRRVEDHSHFCRRVVLLVTLDVKNAFNSVRWNDMLESLEHDFRGPR